MCKIMNIKRKIEGRTKSSKFNGKLITLDVQIFQICLQIRIHRMYKIVKIQQKTVYQSFEFDKKFEIVGCTKSLNLNGKSKNAPNCKN